MIHRVNLQFTALDDRQFLAWLRKSNLTVVWTALNTAGLEFDDPKLYLEFCLRWQHYRSLE